LTLLAPLFLQLALLGIGVTIALHFIVTRQPPSSVLPTTRFVPRDTVQVTTVSRPNDLLLLLLRVLIMLLIGLAFARPVLVADRTPVARIVLADASFAVKDIAEVRDSVRKLLRPQDVFIAFDTAAHTLPISALDTLTATHAPGHLSAALVRALREAAELRARADSIEIVLVSPLRASAVDGATLAIRELWPGPVRIVDVSARTDSAITRGVQIRGAADDDGIRLAFNYTGADAGTRLVRGQLSADDTAWAARGGTLVHWPVATAPQGFAPRSTTDTVGGVLAGDAALVYPLERLWTAKDSAHVAARWIDGEPAALERTVGSGCIREVAVSVPDRGDVVLRPSFARFAQALTAPCTALMTGPPASEETRAAIGGDGPLAHRDIILPPDDIATPLVPWLLATALLLALLELRMRRSHAIARAHELKTQQESAA